MSHAEDVTLKVLGKTIRQQRQQRGFGRRKFAGVVGISEGMLKNIEAGQARTSISVLIRILVRLGLDATQLDRLLGDQVPKEMQIELKDEVCFVTGDDKLPIAVGNAITIRLFLIPKFTNR